MSGETENNVSGWTTDTLKSHFDELRKTDATNTEKRFNLAELAVKQALDNADKASSKADAAMEKRFDGVNEFRKALSDQSSTFIPRSEMENRLDTLNSRLSALEKIANRGEGGGTAVQTFRNNQMAVIAVIVSIASLIIYYFLIHH